MAISMDDVNTLVYKYLSESGFSHSAFLFQNESMIKPNDTYIAQVPSAGLISILQKALLYMKLEKLVKAAKKDENHALHNHISEIEKHFPDLFVPQKKIPPIEQRHTIYLKIPSPEIPTILQGHRLCVFGCAWSPNGKLLTSISADGTTIIWTMVDGVPVSNKIIGLVDDNVTSEHGITTIDWESNGRLFATGSFDTFVRIYKPDGQLYGTLQGHKHNVFTVRFNPSGNYIVTCSADKTAILWNVMNLKIVHIFNQHTDTILDVAWRNDSFFTTASADNTIGIFSIHGTEKFFRGHESHVTAVNWSPDGVLLASASEDRTVRIWSDVRKTIVLRGHETGVSCVKWASSTICVSSSQDGGVRIWDVINGVCLHNLKRHTKDVICLSISPCGQYVASGGTDQTINISQIATGEHIAMIYGKSPIFEIQWDPSGKYLASCFDDATVAIINSSQFLL